MFTMIILIITFIPIIVLIDKNRIFNIFGDLNRYKNVIDETWNKKKLQEFIKDHLYFMR